MDKAKKLALPLIMTLSSMTKYGLLQEAPSVEEINREIFSDIALDLARRAK